MSKSSLNFLESRSPATTNSIYPLSSSLHSTPPIQNHGCPQPKKHRSSPNTHDLLHNPHILTYTLLLSHLHKPTISIYWNGTLDIFPPYLSWLTTHTTPSPSTKGSYTVLICACGFEQTLQDAT
jgi:hypothetical protein